MTKVPAILVGCDVVLLEYVRTGIFVGIGEKIRYYLKEPTIG